MKTKLRFLPLVFPFLGLVLFAQNCSQNGFSGTTFSSNVDDFTAQLSGAKY
jgi:hypothetical protein